jgi:hypothetical protein
MPDSFDLTIEAVEGDFARARLSVSDNSICPAAVFLRRQKGAWAVISMGSVVDPGLYERYHIPEALRL